MLSHRRLHLSRRTFIAGAAAFVASTPFARMAQAKGATEGAWRGLAEKLHGKLLRPNDLGFGSTALPFNLRYAERLPAGIAICKNAEDVATAVLWARENAIPLAARSGGHSYAGFSTTEGLLISTAGLDAVSVDKSSDIATVGGGARNQHVYVELEEAQRIITHGRCLSVGAAGFVLGGGIGFNMRLLGLGCDLLVSTDLVKADGTIVTASASENTDLYWASRGGGGGNFGINTEFRLRTAAAEPRTYFHLRWTQPNETLFAAAVSALDAAPPTLGSRLSLDAFADRPGVSIGLIGQLAGSRKELLAILDPALSLERPVELEVYEVDYWTAQQALIEPSGPVAFNECSRFVPRLPTSELIETAFKWMRQWPGTGESGHTVLFQAGGKINELAHDATAFVHRDNRWLSVIAIGWADDDSDAVIAKASQWQAGYYADLSKLAGGGAYQNFTDPALENWADAYYGGNLARLSQIKRAVDPDNVFNFAQSIPPA